MKRTSPESGLTTPSIAPPLLPLSQGAALVVLNGDGIILDTTWSTEKFKGGISSLAGSTGIHLGIFMSPNPFSTRLVLELCSVALGVLRAFSLRHSEKFCLDLVS